jgi:ethanolamine-phosphate cytidylyltransferase
MSATDPVSPPGDPASELLDGRLWVDGCFDFFHHGHAGAIVQARQLGDELYVGVHSDEAILENKGPTVMDLGERLAAVDACRWVTASVSRAPYVTQLDWISHYGCRYVVHGDDITSDSAGEDCYRFVKAAGRFKVVKRTPSISTTDLVGRMLLCTRTHFIRGLEAVLEGSEGPGTEAERKAAGADMKERMRLYATDESAKAPGADVWFWSASVEAKTDDTAEEKGEFRNLFRGKGVRPGQRVVYVDGGFDLFSSGHIEFLRMVVEEEERLAREQGWYDQQAVDERKGKGDDYGPVFVVAGVHDDHVINEWKGVNYPIMNIYERGLCVLQCKVSTCILVTLVVGALRELTLPSTSTPLSLAHRSRQQKPTSLRFPGAPLTPSATARRPSCLSRTILTRLRRRWASTARSAPTDSRTSTRAPSCSAS